MGILKNICLRIALIKEQRVVIWNALAYSDHTYRRHGNIDGAVVTTDVMKRRLVLRVKSSPKKR